MNTSDETSARRGRKDTNMKKAIFSIDFNYIYDAARKGARYSVNGGASWLNGGEFTEAAVSNGFGYGIEKDANTAFDAGSDIEALHMSVKSSKATLTSEVLGHDLESSLSTYFARCASTCWAWGVVMDDAVTVYIMDEAEFSEFTRAWASYNERNVIRYKATSGKMIAWLESRVEG